ncbi:ROK family protein [Herbidospora galbida]|uniref:ROK family protein n=1 Tax=Herbidospora galbida TaxID=2575442 RepID=A0A4U3MHT3_9ACTN|nr:ROK family protein [Herbidospora galbida]TKK88209.1 ROK family protein [Herbidospora galbida]
MAVLAIDIGGTKCAVALTDASGDILTSEVAPTPSGGDAETLWRALWSLIETTVGAEPVDGVGVGCGGPMTWPDGVVAPLNMPGWRDGFPVVARLRERFPGVPVRIHNDAIALAAAEHWKGAGQGVDDMIGMVVSTGVGGGLILGGRLINGGTGNAGHIGHIVVDPAGPPCGCGGNGCLEAVARGPALAAWAVEQGWVPGTPAAGPVNPELSEREAAALYRENARATGRQLATDAAAGDQIAVAAMNRAGWALGLAIASATHLCDVDLVTIGGGLSQSGPLLFEPLEETLRTHARMGFSSRVRVVPAALGQEAGLIGAAALIVGGDRYWSP